MAGKGAPTNFRAIGLGVAIVALVLVSAALVTVAMQRTAPADNGTPGPIPTFTSTPDASGPSPSATSSASSSTLNASAVAVTARHLAAVSATEAWRSDTGTCSGGDAVLEHTTDGGAHWATVDLGDHDVHTISALAATGNRVSILAGAGADCSAQGMSTTDDGDTWTDDATPRAGVSITATGTLVLPSGEVAAPCTNAAQVVRGDTATAVVCANELDWRLIGGTWTAVPLPGVRAVAINGASYTLARTGLTTCDGVQIGSLAATGITSTSTSTRLGCAPVDDVAAGVALGQSGEHVWLWSGEQTLVSSDGGRSW